MQRRNPGATSALLQKANSQLKGEKIHKPEDELNEYISSLTQKTSQQKKSVNFEDLGSSISISSDIEDIPLKAKPVPTSSAGSKFLKKKTPSTEEPDASPAVSKFLRKPQVAGSSPTPVQGTQARKYGTQPIQGSGSRPGSQTSGRPGNQASSALDKVSALQGKMQQKAATRRVFTLESDSDESFSAMKMTKTIGEPLSDLQSTESIKVGRDGGKFMKKASPASSEPPLTSVTQQAASPFKKAPQQSPAKPVNQQTTPQKKASPFTLKSSLRHSTDVVLTSEEESLAEFVGGLPSSSGDSFERPRHQHGRPGRRLTPSPPPSRQGRRGPSPPQPARSERPRSGGQSRSPSPVKGQMRRSPSPRTSGQSPSPNLRRRSPSPKLMRSYSDDSNVADSIMSEVAEDYDIGVNIIMDLDELGPALEDESLPEVIQPRSDSPFRASVRKTEKEERGKKSSLKSTPDTAARDKDRGSPFKSSAGREESPFKSSSKTKDKSPFIASSDSPFKSSSAKEKSAFKSKDTSSPFKANNKENTSPFKAKSAEDSPFKTKERGGSLFKASTEGSVFKSSDKKGSPFKAKGSSRYDSDQNKSTSRATPRKSKKNKQKKEKRSNSKSKTKAKDPNKDLFSTFGIQSVEDLFGNSVKVSEYESIADDLDDRSEVSEEIRTEKPSAYSYSRKFEESITDIVTEVNGTKPSYTDDFDSISERIGAASDTGVSSASEVKTRYSGEETVAEYTEFSESDTETVSDSYTYTEDRTYSETRKDDDSYASYSEDFTKSLVPTSRSDMTPVLPRGMANSGVQTATDGLQYSWNALGSGLSFPGVPYGLSFVDPTPIATHVVSADALEAMTAYSPAMIALHDMLKSQMDLTREFLESQKRMYHEFTANVEPTFHYTTLQDTKKYIQKNKQKKLTFKQALKLVDKEMSR